LSGTSSAGGLAAAPVASEAIPWRRLSAMAAVALGLGLWALWVVPARLAPPQPRAAAPLVPIDPSAVRQIELQSGPLEARLYRTPGGGWSLSGPTIEGQRTIASDPIETFLDVVHSLPRLTQFVETDLAAFGLAPPRGRVAIQTEREAMTIVIGDRNAPLTALYVQVLPAPDVVLVGSVVFWEFDKLVGSIDREAGRAGDGADAALGR